MILKKTGTIASVISAVGRLMSRLARGVGGFIHVVAAPAGVAQASQDSEGMHPSAVSGAMIAGAGREIGQATNEMPDDHDPERDWRDR